MAGSYRKQSIRRRERRSAGNLLWMVVVFVAGYATASLCDFTRVSAWVTQHVLAGKNSSAVIHRPNQHAQLPKPKLEFYTLLANEQVGTQAPVAMTQAQQPPLPAALSQTAPAKVLPLHAPLAPVVAATSAPVIKKPSGSYLVQVASFRVSREAEHMKASLLMKGFDATIVTVRQQQVNWYRVMMGPFDSHAQAQQAQLAFARREHVMGMIRKMDA